MSQNPIEGIEQISKIQKLSKTLEQVEAVGQNNLGKDGPGGEHFGRLLAEKTQEVQQAKAQEQLSSQRPTPIEAAQETQRRIIHRRDDAWKGLVADSDAAVTRIDGLKEQLNTVNSEISRPVRSSMQRSLIHIDESLKIALSKVGVDYTPPTNNAPGLVAPVQKFLGYLSNGQAQLEALSTQLTTLNERNEHITPANMLALQLKMGVITQQIEFFSSLLNKCLESTKTIMNVQV